MHPEIRVVHVDLVGALRAYLRRRVLRSAPALSRAARRVAVEAAQETGEKRETESASMSRSSGVRTVAICAQSLPLWSVLPDIQAAEGEERIDESKDAIPKRLA